MVIAHAVDALGSFSSYSGYFFKYRVMIISGFGIVCNFWTVGTLPLSPYEKKLDKLQIFKMSGIGAPKGGVRAPGRPDAR